MLSNSGIDRTPAGSVGPLVAAADAVDLHGWHDDEEVDRLEELARNRMTNDETRMTKQ